MIGARTVALSTLVLVLSGCGAVGTVAPQRVVVVSTAPSPPATRTAVTPSPVPVAPAAEAPAPRASSVAGGKPSSTDLPTARPRPRYLTRSYQAPVEPSARSSARRAGTLRIPSLRVVAPVYAVGLDRGVMAIPNSPAQLGWLRSTAAAADPIGASVLSGHVSDRRDVPGVMGRLRTIRRGAVISWTGNRGDRHRFVVTGVRRYPRAKGVPANLFRVTGPHVLHLVTCADRVRTAGGGFHYTANLVVTAREVRPASG